jgi:hypothetical protein
MKRNALSFGSKLTLLPVVHGSAAYAVAVRRFLLENRFDCVAVPLPSSFERSVIEGVLQLPTPSAAVHRTSDGDDNELPATYVPIDPCQAVIAAIRFALSERIPIKFVDSDDPVFESEASFFPDPFALRSTTIERFATASLPAIDRPSSRNRIRRIRAIATEARRLTRHYESVVCLCDLQDWPWVREALSLGESFSDDSSFGLSYEETDGPQMADRHSASEVGLYGVDDRTLLFFLCELPFITSLYERARQSLDEDDALVVEGLKELFVSARQSYLADLGKRARKITPLLISQCLKYIRNQSLLEHRFSPSFYTIAKSSQQMMGDQYTIHLVEAAKNYAFDEPLPWPTLRMGINEADLPGVGKTPMVSRLPGMPLEWRALELNRPAFKNDKRKWSTRWNPYQQCSWPEEDTRIESFRNRVLERAAGLIGADLARTEKFSTSMMDGLDLRETLRHWYDGSLYVKVLPPSVGNLDATVMLFDNEPDPQEFSWRATWFAEHDEESTLAFYATPFQKEMLGPGVAVSTYGGAMFLFPPRPIEDIWEDEVLDFCDTLEQRLVAAACMHSQSRHIALLSWGPPGFALKKIAKMFKRALVHVPLGHFADSVVQQLRTFHVLNGQHVRSYAAHFIRKS